MPLNMQDQNDEPLSQENEPQPITHDPDSRTPHTKSALIVIFVLIAVIATVFLIYKLTTGSGSTATTTATTEVPLERIDTAGPPPLHAEEQSPAVSQQPTVVTPKEEIPRKEEPPKLPAKSSTVSTPPEKGNYTVFVGSFRVKSNAERLALRLREAGLDPVVVLRGSLSIVSWGSFRSKEEARAAAEKNKKFYPDGYHLGKVE